MACSIAAAAFLAACGAFGNDNPNAPSAPSSAPAPGSTITYTALGASDTAGYGSSVPCVPFTDCPNGMGYVQVATRQLNAQGYKATLSNLGIPTTVIGPDFEALGQQYNRTIIGNLLDREVPFVPPNATVVSVFIGGNDVNTISSALGAGAGGSDPAGYIDQQVKAFGADYAALVKGVRSRAASARLIALNLPNLAGLPYLAGNSLPQRQAAQRAAVGMTKVVNALTSQGVTVIDLMCDARTYQSSSVSSDGFHPSDAGYAFIAAELVKAITSTSYPAPSASCAQMTLVP